LDLVLHPVASSLNDHGFGVMREPIWHGAGEGAVIIEDFEPMLVVGLVVRTIEPCA